MLLKKCSSFTLFLGILSSITCQGVSGTGDVFGGKSDYIYIDENSGQSSEEVKGEEESLVSKAKNKLKQAKNFISENPVKVGAVCLAAAVTPALAYAGVQDKAALFRRK